MTSTILIVGCGLSGAVMAERLASKGYKIVIIDKRDHIGGNVYDYIDFETGIRVSKYGAHLFHTNNEIVWKYVNLFSEWVRWDHQVLSACDDKLVSIPVNITTVNSLCDQSLQTPEEMKEWLDKNQEKYDTIDNSEKMAKSRVGSILYEKLFKSYTYKQWEKNPEELDPAVLARIPIRFTHDTRYFNDKYQALPKHGYTAFIDSILNSENITVLLNTDYFEYIKENNEIFDEIIYTGPIDSFYKDVGFEPLEYRSIEFIIEKYKNMNYYQQNSVVNYPSLDVPYTRIVEYKHFLNQKSDDTIIVKEITKSDGEPYYPILNKKNMDLYEKYKALSMKENKIHFLGRLANYKYFNMDEAILNSLVYANKFIINHPHL
jgi:UDP-galactopyranose mutase